MPRKIRRGPANNATTSRAVTTAEYPNIVYNEFMPMLVGRSLGNYRDHDLSLNAQVTQEH